MRAPGGAVSLSIVGIPGGQLPGRQRLGAQGSEQCLGIGAVGARQRYEHPAGRPGRERALAHRLLHRIGQLRQQRQAPADPTGVLAQGGSQRTLAHSLAQGCRQQPGLLDGLERAPLMASQDLRQGCRNGTVPHLDQGGIAAQALERLPALIAVDQHEALAPADHRQRDPLAVGVDGGHQSAHLRGALHPGLGIGGIETMQVQLRAVAGGGVHGPYASPDNPAKTIESSLCNPPPRRLTRPYRTEYKKVLAVDTSTFAIPRPAPRLHAISDCRQRAFRRPRGLFCNPRVGCRSAPGVTHALRRTVARYVPGMALAPGASAVLARLARQYCGCACDQARWAAWSLAR